MRRTSKAATAGSTKRLGRSKPALLLCVLAASVAVLALVVGSASGATTRFLVEVFGSSAQPTFSADRGMAFDQGASQLYVIDSTNDTISRFNANGTAADFGALGSNVIDGEGTGDETPLGHLAFESNRQREQLAIDESGGATDGNIYATRSASDVVDVFSSSGEYKGTLSESTGTGAFGEPCGVAVDASGNVYVGDRGDDRIHVYEPAGAVPVNADNTTSFATVTDPCTLAAGAGATAGFLFVNASTGAQLRKVDATTGEVKYQLTTGGSTVSVDPTTGHVFVARNTFGSSSVDQYDASGAASATLVSSFKPGSTVEGIALNSGAEQVYVARSGTEAVEVFGPAAIVPDVVTSPPSSNTGVRATLAGTVNPDGVELDECFFEWGQGSGNAPYTETTPCAETPAEIGAGTAPVAVHADLDGLIPQGTGYHYRLVAENPNGTVNGSNQNFITPDTVVTGAATGITPTEATLNGTVNPDGTALTECVFEWGPEKEPHQNMQAYPEAAPCTPGPGGIGGGVTPVAVEADLSSLHPGTVYLFRLRAGNANGPILGDESSAQTLGPRIAASWAENVNFDEATVRADIDPEGSATTYRIEHGETQAYGSETPELAVGSDSAVHEMSRVLTGLEPGTTYHYRVVATNAAATNAGPDRTIMTYAPLQPEAGCSNDALRTGPSAKLPDCRAYEMVSPVDKNGGDILGAEACCLGARAALEQSSSSGHRITFTSGTSFGDQVSSINANQYIATRTDAGWQTKGINPPRGENIFAPEPLGVFAALHVPYQGFTEDLSIGWLASEKAMTPDEVEGELHLYRADTVNGAVEAVGAVPPVWNTDNLGFNGASADGRHQVFFAETALYDLVDGELHRVDILPDGSMGTGARTGTTNDAHWSRTRNQVDRAVSDDGSRIFWTNNVGSGVLNPIYVRKNPAEEQSALSGEECTEPAKACTVPVSESVTAPGARARFWTASTDGSKSLFSFDPDGAGSQLESLYEFDVEAEASSLVAEDVLGVAGASEDLSHIYFASRDALAPGAVEGQMNLYLEREGAMRYIARIDSAAEGKTFVSSQFTAVASNPIKRASRVTPDGGHLVFQSANSLTGYDNLTTDNGEPAIEVYRYAADEDELSCVSCKPSGARPTGRRLGEPFKNRMELPEPDFAMAAAWIPTWEHEFRASRVISDDGSRVFFHGIDELVPWDNNGRQDVYQWTAQGAGGCERVEGCLSLLSGGGSGEASEFVDASVTGDDVFIRTQASFDPRDPGSLDIYDARVNGGFPVPPSPPECVGDACQSVPPPPEIPTPASAAFRGAGDPPRRRNCSSVGRRAAKLSRRARRVSRAARRSAADKRSKRLRRRSVRLTKRARQLSKRATRCRRAVRGVTR